MPAGNCQDVVRLRQAPLNMFVSGKYCWRYSRIRKAGLDLKAATLVLIEKGSKDRWGIEFWVTEKVNRSIHAYKRDRILLITP